MTGRTVDEFKQAHVPDADVVYLRRRVAELEAKLDSEKSSRGEVLETLFEFREALREAEPPVLRVDATPVAPGAPVEHVVHLTDWHYGAIIKKDEVDGFGEYNPEIAEERVRALAEKIVRYTRVLRHGYNIPTLRVLVTADMISGGIHQELLVTNAFPEPRQAVECGYLLGAWIAMMGAHYPRILVDFVTLDNHGRITKKPQAAEGGLNNWCYVVAEVAKRYCVNVGSLVEFNVHAKPSALVAVGPERYLISHGHQIKSWAGIPYYGLDRRVAMEAVKRMGLPDVAFTKLVTGHLHHAIDGMAWNLGGSLSGTDAFDHSCGRHAPPHQTSWLVHPENGEFSFTRWWL